MLQAKTLDWLKEVIPGLGREFEMNWIDVF
jgi:hypothetical protein